MTAWDGRIPATVIRTRAQLPGALSKGVRTGFHLSCDVQAATTTEALTRGQGLAVLVADLDWDEYSLWCTARVVAPAPELADRSTWARQAIWLSLDA